MNWKPAKLQMNLLYSQADAIALKKNCKAVKAHVWGQTKFKE